MHKSKSIERALFTKISKSAHSALVSFSFQFGSFSQAEGFREIDGTADGSKEGIVLGSTVGTADGTREGISLG